MINVLAYAVIAIVLCGVLVIALGPVFSQFVDVANYMSGQGLLAPQLMSTLDIIFSFWVWFPVLVLVTAGFYVLRRAIQKGPDERQW